MSFQKAHRVAVAVLALALIAGGLGPATAASAKSSSETQGGASAQGPVDLNRATAEELEGLPGIGPVTAQRIVEFREEHGPFRRVEDLMKVKGIGEKSFQKLRSKVRVAVDD